MKKHISIAALTAALAMSTGALAQSPPPLDPDPGATLLVTVTNPAKDKLTVTTPGWLRYVTKKVVRYVPVVKKRTVLVNGKTTTVTATQLVPTVKTETSVQTVTNQSTVVVGIVVFATLAVIVFNFIVDVAYAWLDPRIRLTT